MYVWVLKISWFFWWLVPYEGKMLGHCGRARREWGPATNWWAWEGDDDKPHTKCHHRARSKLVDSAMRKMPSAVAIYSSLHQCDRRHCPGLPWIVSRISYRQQPLTSPSLQSSPFAHISNFCRIAANQSSNSNMLLTELAWVAVDATACAINYCFLCD
jgi:hypothetical protein